LAHYERLSGDSVFREADALVAFAETHGVDIRTHAVLDQVRDDGFCLKPSSRAWPNTERIKAHLALFELAQRDPRPVVQGSVKLLLDRYLTPSGSWIDQFDGDGRAIAATAPASTFYHVFLAFAEVLRLEPRLSRVDAV
jgi:mannose/cellobiose epimerase-like protein (N-acyl-D-glucosamine 2-epimerase family)